MITQPSPQHRLVGAIVGAWLAVQLAAMSGLPFLILAAPVAAVIGASSTGQRAARPALALVAGSMAGIVVTLIVSLLGFTIIVAAPLAVGTLIGVTAVLWSTFPSSDRELVPVPVRSGG